MNSLYKFLKAIILLLIILCVTPCLHAQNIHKIDSLKKLLLTTKIDTVKMNLMNNIGILYQSYNTDSALHYFNKNLILATKHNNKRFMVLSYSNIASTYSKKGLNNKSIDYTLKGMNLLSEGTSDYYMKRYNSYSNYFSEIKSTDNGIQLGIDEKYSKKLYKYFLNQLNDPKNKKDTHSMAKIEMQMVTFYYLEKKYKTALEQLRKCIKIFEEYNDKDFLALSNQYIATTYNLIAMEEKDKTKSLNLSDSALSYYFKSLNIYEENGNNIQIAQMLGSIATTYFMIKNYNQAILYAQKALKIAVSTGIMNEQKLSYSILYRAYDSLGDYKNAYKNQSLFMKIKDSINHEENADKISKVLSKYEIKIKEKEVQNKEKELQISNLAISRMNYIMILLGLVVILISCIGYIIIRRNKHQATIKNIQLEQKLLQSQTNPHFIFNALSVIQSIIYEKKTDLAGKYLLRFAKLTRMILENSRSEYIALSKEMMMLENYMELQKLCFENKFIYSIGANPELTPEDISIPPMLAQPFIENAIEHGIAHKTGIGNIRISFKKGTDMLLFEVEDDGVGREKAKEIEEMNGSGKKHTSLATAITQERIANINKSLKKNKKIKMDIIDLKDNNGVGIGTRVSFSIPLIRM